MMDEIILIARLSEHPSINFFNTVHQDQIALVSSFLTIRRRLKITQPKSSGKATFKNLYN